MKKLVYCVILMAGMLLTTQTFAGLFFDDSQIIREGTMIVYSSDARCLAIDLKNIDIIIPEGASSVLDVISKMLNSKHAITADELALCNAGGVISPLYGFSFRKSAGYVDDAIGDIPVSATEYTDNLKYGWVGAVPSLYDRSATVDPRMAGVAIAPNDGVGQLEFRIDLPSTGKYEIRLAIGDAKYSKANSFVQLIDGDTVISTIDKSGTETKVGEFIDAKGVSHLSSASWALRNAPVGYVFSTKILRVLIGQPVPSTRATSIAYILVKKVSD